MTRHRLGLDDDWNDYGPDDVEAAPPLTDEERREILGNLLDTRETQTVIAYRCGTPVTIDELDDDQPF